MVFVGVDIAKASHVACAVDETGKKLTNPFPFKNTEEGFERLIAWLEGVAESSEDAFVAMEATGHYWMTCFAYLNAHDYRVCVVNPLQVKAMRELKGFSRVKNDPIDSWLIAETLRLGDIDETKLATDDIQALRSLTRYHQALKQETACVKTQLTCVMDSYFPEYADIFSDMFGAASMAVLKKSALPHELSRAHTSALGKTIMEASHGRLGVEKAAQVEAAAKRSVGIQLGQDAAAFQIKTMVSQIEFLNATCAKVEAKVEALLMRIEPLILTIPGISVATGAQIVAEVGDVRRFKNAAAIVKYAGLNPGVSQSGQFEAKGSPITKKGSPYLRRALWLAANQMRRFDPKMRAYYDKLRDEGKCHRVAVTACARKLCHVVFAVMRDLVPYDPGR